MKVVFSDRAYASIMSETMEKIKTETGGLFLGTYKDHTWYVVEAIDPGPESVFEVAYFEYDQKYVQHLINKIANLYDRKLELIGLWHRHPGSMDVFSTTDGGTNSDYARMRPEGAISALVNVDPDFRLTVYHVAQPCIYRTIRYEVGNDKIPQEYRKLKTPDRFEEMMKSRLYGRPAGEYHRSLSMKSFMKRILPFLEEYAEDKKIEKQTGEEEEIRARIVNILLADILFMTDKLGIEMSVIQQSCFVALVQDSLEGVEQVIFAAQKEPEQIVFRYEGKNYLYEEGLFEKLFRQMAAQRKYDK